MKLFLLSPLGLMAAAKNETDAAATVTAATKPKDTSPAVKVRVLANSLGEEDKTYAKGETFTTTENRAKALGDSVEPA